MRYLAVSTCFLFVLCAACTFDDGDDPTKESATAVAGQTLIVDIGLARVQIDAPAIGTGVGQLPPGSKVALKVVSATIAGHKLYSPIVEVSATQPSGAAVTGLNLSPAARFEMSFDEGLAGRDSKAPADLSLLKIDGATTKQLVYIAAAPAANNEWTQVGSGRARTEATAFSRFVMADKTAGAVTPTPVALTGTVSTIATFTVFQLANSGATTSVNLAIPTADTTTPPTVLTLNDASYNAANPLAATNRVVTVTTGGTTYTSDSAAASVSVQINTFTVSASSGSMIGTVVQQGGAATLAINFTWTTGGAAAQALGGTMTDLAGRRTVTLTDAAQAVQLTVLMPDTFPNVALDPVTFTDATFDATNPLLATGRVVAVVEAGVTYTSDVPVVGSVTITFQTFNSATRVGTGTITGTVVSATPSTKSLNYSFATTGGNTGGGTGTLTPGTPADITTTDQADETAVVFNGTDYVGVWLSNTGTTNRTLEFNTINETTMAAGTQKGFEPSVDLAPVAGVSAAVSGTGMILVVGATGTDAAASLIHAVLFDYAAGTGTDISVGTGTRPLVTFNAQSGNFVVAWQQTADAAARCYTVAGAPVAAATVAITAAGLRGLASASGTNDEVLVTGDDTTGIVGRRVTPSTGAVAAANFDLSTSGGGGVVAWDAVANQYLVITETLVLGFFDAQVVKAVAAGSITPVAGTLTLAALTGITGAVGGTQGVVFTDANTNLYAVKGGVSGPALAGVPVFGAATGVNSDGTANGPALGAGTTGRYVALAARGAGGVEVLPLTVAP